MRLPGFSAESIFPPDAPEDQTSADGASRPYRVSVPGLSGDVGLGDVVKSVTSSIGIAPCGGCLRRAQALNSWMVFSGSKRQ